jgi:hypothetical protein
MGYDNTALISLLQSNFLSSLTLFHSTKSTSNVSVILKSLYSSKLLTSIIKYVFKQFFTLKYSSVYASDYQFLFLIISIFFIVKL